MPIGRIFDLHLPLLSIFIILGFVFLFISDRIRKKKFPIMIQLIRYSIVIYVLFVIKLVFFPIMYLYKSSSAEITQSMFYQLIPFHEIYKTFFVTGNYIQVFGNLLLLFPLGVYMGLLSKKAVSVKYVFKISLFTTLTIETVQLIIDYITFMPNKIFDIDDIILNVTGCLLGWLFLKFLSSELEKLQIPTAFQNRK
ncbi:VanZ family protein [Bacillus cereus]|uniref:VanZ family protein n=1 Tax=Bacillus cereus TaxID=1396 RepID=A0A9W7PZF8_BACCE|nr:VanZ family protein [Bacillus cereus]KAA6448140.1 VanZ family protein [Bacillus cereus]KAB2502513.1 VanZ family protein [Bacillus cereus]